MIALVGVGFKVCSTEAFGTHAPYSRIVPIEGERGSICPSVCVLRSEFPLPQPG